MTDKLAAIWDKSEAKEDRPSFIAALLMERCRKAVPEYNGGGTEPLLNAAQASRIAVALCATASQIKGLAEAECNGELTPGQQRRADKLAALFAQIADAIGFDSRTGGDPRGACAYLIDRNDPKAGDGWGDGFAVYAR